MNPTYIVAMSVLVLAACGGGSDGAPGKDGTAGKDGATVVMPQPVIVNHGIPEQAPPCGNPHGHHNGPGGHSHEHF